MQDQCCKVMKSCHFQKTASEVMTEKRGLFTASYDDMKEPFKPPECIQTVDRSGGTTGGVGRREATSQPAKAKGQRGRGGVKKSSETPNQKSRL